MFLPASLSTSFLIWAGIEIALIPVWFLVKKRLSPVRKVPELDSSHRRTLWRDIVAEIDPLEAFLPHWFVPRVPFEAIRMDNALEFIGWAFWHKPLSGRPHPGHVSEPMTEEDIVEAREMIEEARSKFNCPELLEGYNEDIVCSRLTMDDIRALPRPWSVYLATHALGYVHDLYLEKRHGFVSKAHQRFSYLVYHPTEPSKEEPIVFIHGIGIGLVPYHRFLALLRAQYPNRTILLLLLPHVSMRAQPYVPSRSEFVAATSEIMALEGITRARYVAHSLGTICFAWIARHAAHLVSEKGAILIDPVCFGLWDGAVAHNFIYRDTFEDFSDTIVRYAAGRELFAAHALSRHFVWHENMLLATHLKQLGVPVRTFIAEKDAIADPVRCVDWCGRHGVQVDLMEGLGHAGWLAKGNWTEKIVDVI